VYDFLLVINSNLDPISQCFYDMAIYWLKIANFFYPFSFSAPARGDPFPKSFMNPETKVFQAADGVDLVILVCTIFD